MKIAVNILLLAILFIVVPVAGLRNLVGSKRHVIVRQHHDHGAVVINNKKMRVPYITQETAIPTQTDGLIDYLFLDDYQICLGSALTLFAMGLLLIGIYLINTIEGRLLKYRTTILKGLLLTLILFTISEISSSYVYQDWVIDTSHGINGNDSLFGINATFPNTSLTTPDLSYHADIQLFIAPLITLAVIMRNAKRKDDPIA